MAKVWRMFGLLTLLCLSFIYTEKTVSVVKEYDEIMIKIKEFSSNYNTQSIDAKIENNTIRPGVSGKQININKSYSKMKRYGKYNEQLFVYDTVLPKISISNQYDKYVIGGNTTKNQVSLLFLTYSDDSIEEIVSILNSHKIVGNFFIDKEWVDSYTEEAISLIEQGHILGNISENHIYTKDSFLYIDNLIKKVGKQKTSYCFLWEENEDYLNKCAEEKDYTIMTDILIKNSSLETLKKNLKPGSIIAIKNSKNVSLDFIIRYIESKGYQIVGLDTLLTE